MEQHVFDLEGLKGTTGRKGPSRIRGSPWQYSKYEF